MEGVPQVKTETRRDCEKRRLKRRLKKFCKQTGLPKREAMRRLLMVGDLIVYCLSQGGTFQLVYPGELPEAIHFGISRRKKKKKLPSPPSYGRLRLIGGLDFSPERSS
jgi:hypothetical protein